MFARVRLVSAAIGAALLLASCSQSGGDAVQTASSEPVFHAEGNPERLSDWNLLRVSDGALSLNDRVTAYDLNSSLFTDYAHKLRTVWLPEGQSANYAARETFDFPVGTVISKTFYYPVGDGDLLKEDDRTAERLKDGFVLSDVQLIETRLLIHREEGWVALPYVWNEEQTDAVLKRTGDAQRLRMASGDSAQDFNYIVPNANQCAGCHATNATTKKIEPIGPKARHLNKAFAYRDGAQNQLAAWTTAGLLSGAPDAGEAPRAAVWSDGSASLDERARAYLDINCAHCHNRVGPADTSGLLLEHDAPVAQSLGLCKLPIAAGKGTGGRLYGIVPGKPDESIFHFRMESTDPSIMMPELGRSLAHTEGVALIDQWISEMPGACS
ncbi:SO2930 family diheme c-type cytochrome [Altererythrobacter sp. MF3-039]|uniref:SO2930 family diheme c-type cytochrome n=1 Tax=Altererythrobacter sp. MF3-039 TaxID=3252901 RepID=UPI00390C803D